MSKKINKLLIATGIYPPDIGGPATYAKLLNDELPKKGVAVSVLSFGEVRHLPKIIRHLYYFILVFRKLRRVSVVLAQDTVSVGLPTLVASKILGKRMIIRVPGDYAWEQSTQRFGVKDSIDDFQTKKYGLRVELLRMIQKFVVSHVDLVITPSDYFNRLVSGWIEKKGVVTTIYNGINLEDGRLAVAKQFTRPTIISAGRLVPWKGYDILIKLMKDLPAYDLIIIGDGPERKSLEKKIEELGLGHQVKITGSLPRNKMLGMLKGAQVFVLNTHFESFSFQIVEAMNAGIPVIATNIGNLSEIIENGEEGILVTPDDTKGILRSIQIIERPEFRDKMVKKALAKADIFSINQTIAKLIKQLESLGI